MDWDIAGDRYFCVSLELGGMGMEGEWEGEGEGETHAKVASVAPSIMMGGAAPSDASHSSLTNEPHMRIISTGDKAILTIPTSAFACSGFCNA